MGRLRQWIGALIIVTASTQCALGNSENEISQIESGIAQAGEPAPDFLLMDLERNQIRLSGFRGKPVVLNFFASWCSPCLEELPMLQEAHLRSADEGFIVLGVGYQDSRWAIEDLAEDVGLTFTIVIDGDNSVGQAYRVIGPPYTFFIDPTGVILSVVPGAMDADTLQVNLDRLLQETERVSPRTGGELNSAGLRVNAEIGRD